MNLSESLSLVGLITPLLRDVDKMGLMGINSQMKTLISKSKEGKLLPEEYAVLHLAFIHSLISSPAA